MKRQRSPDKSRDRDLDLPGHVWVPVTQDQLNALLSGTAESRKAKRDKDAGIVTPRKRLKLL